MKRLPIESYFFLLSVLASVFAGTFAYGGGPLTPSAAPGVSMKTLDEVEPRGLINSLPHTITTPGSYYVVSNLTSTGHGIVIESSGVTVDLMGFTLTGDETVIDIGLHVAGTLSNQFENITVRNGHIHNFGFGLQVDTANGCQFSDLQISGNSVLGVVFNGENGICRGNQLSHSTVRDNNFTGILLTGKNGQNQGNAITDCTITTNRVQGIVLLGQDGLVTGNRIDACRVFQNGAEGILLSGAGNGNCSGNTIADCSIFENGASGIRLDGQINGLANGNRIDSCTLALNNNIDIVLNGDTNGVCEGNTIVNCTVRSKIRVGIALAISKKNWVDQCHVTALGLGAGGISSSTGSTNNIITRNYAGLYQFSADDTYGPIVTINGALSSTGMPSHPWMNFQP